MLNQLDTSKLQSQRKHLQDTINPTYGPLTSQASNVSLKFIKILKHLSRARLTKQVDGLKAL